MGKKNKQSKAKPLTGLAAALVKSGHMKESAAREIKRDQRREEKALGREEVERRQAEEQAKLEAQRAREAEAQRERENLRVQKEAHERARRAILDGTCGRPGNRKFFFVARDKRIPFLSVADSVAGQLTDGEAGIVESCGALPDPHVVVTQRALTTLVAIDPELVRFWNRGGRPPR